MNVLLYIVLNVEDESFLLIYMETFAPSVPSDPDRKLASPKSNSLEKTTSSQLGVQLRILLAKICNKILDKGFDISLF